MTGPNAGALSGLVVADFTRVLAGPYATMLLADFGADVVKIERPVTGDDTRAWGPPVDSTGTATYFNAVNRNKRSVVLDLTTEDGRMRALEIVRNADIVVENFRSGTMERLGLGYDDLAAVKPDLIYCSITGFGSGAGAHLAGYDLLVQAVGGLMSVTGPEAGQPTKVGVAVVDVLTGLHALTGVLTALHHRNTTGEGQRIDTNLLSVLLSSLVNQTSGYLGAGVVPGIMGSRHPSIAPYQVFPTADRDIVVAVGTDGQFTQLAQAVGMPELSGRSEFSCNAARVAHRDELAALIADRLVRHGADHWFSTLSALGIPAGPINDVGEAIEFARTLGLDTVIDVPGTRTPQMANPLTLSKTPASYRSGPPALEDAPHWR